MEVLCFRQSSIEKTDGQRMRYEKTCATPNVVVSTEGPIDGLNTRTRERGELALCTFAAP